MNNEKFLFDFLSEYEEGFQTGYSLESEFRNIDGWDSMTALMIISMIDEKYNVIIDPDQMKEAKKIIDIYNLVTN